MWLDGNEQSYGRQTAADFCNMWLYTELTASKPMPFQLNHTLVSARFRASKKTSGETAFFTVNRSGQFPVLFTGRVQPSFSATFTHRIRIPKPKPVAGQPTEPGTAPLHGNFKIETKTIPLKLRIFTPDGREFTAKDVTVADLRKFRDQRGNSLPWSFKLTGESEHIFVDEDSAIFNPKGTIGVRLVETVPSESAPPLVDNAQVLLPQVTFRFDLFRVGTFVAEISPGAIAVPFKGTMRLLNPDGAEAAKTTGRRLTFAVGLATLNQSRDAAGKVRQWTLEVKPQGGLTFGKPHVSATVIETGRITLSALRSRIDALLGPKGQFIRIFGENKDGDALGRLEIKDPVSAETIDMQDLLDGVLDQDDQDEGVDIGHIRPNVVYTVGRTSEDLPGPLKLDVQTLKVAGIEVVLGPGVKLGAAVPTLKLTVAVSGAVKIKLGPATLASGEVRGGKFEIEVGMKLEPDGTPRLVTAVPDRPFDIDISTGAKVALAAVLGPGGLIGGQTFGELAEHKINGAIVKGIRSFLAEPTIAPRILMLIFGAHFTYKPFRIENDQFVFDHVAPVEPEPKPTPGYHGAIGRSFTQAIAGQVSFNPPDLGDTWRAENLVKKIKHIVVVMMENRSYDHVLGYRSLPGSREEADGLSQEIIQAFAEIKAADGGPFHVRNLKDAAFAANEVDLKTRLPKGVGHALADVAEQLSVRTTLSGGRSINSPRGFVENFKSRLKFDDDKERDGLVPDKDGVARDDVLGFYDQASLPMFDFLARNYSYCDHYFCSHPGPTLPNRMYSLVGDLQHDRYGFPVLDNNNGDNFLLSRATTIYDLLTRKGVSYRVYESQPSVTMLRMFARYSTDTVNIVPIEQLKRDVAAGNLPDFTVIEPQMHAHPEDDDHPDADMHRGQHFLRNVYTTLTSNPALWKDTLLIITYDEHGGLYDHVVPPLADVFVRPDGQVATAGGSAGGGTGPAVLTVPYGVRVPTFVVSPWSTPGPKDRVLDHCSILKTVLARFLGNEKPFLSDRVHASNSFEAFLTEAAPRMDVGPLPDLKPPLSIGVRRSPSPTTKIVTPPLSRAEMRAGPVEYHELSGRWARQLGR